MLFVSIDRLLYYSTFNIKQQDETNINGGKWIVRLKKGLADRLWENLVRPRLFTLILTL